MLCGFRAARFEVIVTLDDDLQHLPEEIVKLLEKLEDGYDVVYGAAESDGAWSVAEVASRLTKIALQKATGAETASRRLARFAQSGRRCGTRSPSTIVRT